MNLKEFFTPQAVAANWAAVNAQAAPYLGAGLFPARKKAGLDLTWLKGAKGLPVSLMPAAFDAKAPLRDRIGCDKLEAEMPFFREGFKLKERDRQELLRSVDASDPYALAMMERLFEDTCELIEAANVVPERMICQLLFPENGNMMISIRANGVDYSYNYDEDGSWKKNHFVQLSGSDCWSNANSADPFRDFKNARDLVRQASGVELTTAIMSTNTFELLAASDAVKDRFLSAFSIPRGFLFEEDVKTVIKGAAKMQIALYDRMYRDENHTAHPFVPDGYVCLVPDGTLGATWYGTTPEEADLSAAQNADVAIVNTGVAVSRIVGEHPVNLNTFVSEIVLPSFERMDEVVVLKVSA
ncbi:MAG: major capsid protein [Oscillospiraceae bacterium]|nr:major capsid protein [Oscillospiraceae bacterium]